MQLQITEEGHEPVLVTVPSPESAAVLTIGRSHENDVVLTQTFVSGHHARLYAGVMVEDQGSRNGTYVDGERINEPTLLLGRPFSVGGLTLSIVPQFGEGDGLAAKLAASVAALPKSGGTNSRPSPSLVAHDESPLLGQLVAQDFEDTDVPPEATVTDVYVHEAFQFIRNAERIISKIAGGLTKELSQQTALPDADKNFRTHMAELLVQRQDSDKRAELHEYLNHMFEWLYASVHCYQKAALEVVDELKGELSRAALLRGDLLPWHTRLLHLERAMLWDRAEERLEDWTQSHVIDRLEAQVTHAAKAFRMAQNFDDL